MYLHRHIALKKFIAAFLLWLLGFIYAEKAFHEHEKRIAAADHVITHETGKSTECSICEFQLAKAPCLPVLAHAEAPVYFFENEFGYSLIVYISSSSNDIAGRGPPVC